MIKKITPILFLFFLFVSCVSEIESTGGGNTTEPQLDATITLLVAENSSESTRAMDGDDENSIKEIDLLIFTKSSASVADNDAEFFYRGQADYITDDANDSNKKSFRISLKKSDLLQQFVVLANSRRMVDSLVTLDAFTGQTRQQIIEKLVMRRPAGWNSRTDTYTPLPMWGETAFRAITDAASARCEITMTRALARIDVVVDAAAQSDFVLNGVWLYKASTQGRIAGGTSTTDIVLPSMGRGVAADPFEYTTLTTAGTELKGVIYTFEAPAATTNVDTSNAFLIVRGSWNGEDNSYYRIDFHDGSNFLPLIRNYVYSVAITEVKGRGYPSADEAIIAGFTEMSATTMTWDAGNMGSVVWDGRYMLGVTQTEYLLTLDDQNISTLNAVTNYPDGWEATLEFNSADGANWITMSTSNGSGNSPEPITLAVTKNIVVKRTATVTVTAGRLKQVITITQNLLNDLALDVGDVEIVFSASDPQTFSLPIEWEPAADNITVTMIDAGTGAASAYPSLSGYTNGGLKFVNSGSITPAGSFGDTDSDPSNGGMRFHEIKPDAVTTMAVFGERRSIMHVSSTNGVDTEYKDVLLRQFDYAITVVPTSNVVSMNSNGDTGSVNCQLGTTYSFTLKANAEWEVVDAGNMGSITLLSATEGEPDISGNTIVNIKTSNTNGEVAKLKFLLKEHPEVYQYLEITHKLNEPNCYIINQAGGSVTIPIRKVFEVWSTDVDLIAENAMAVGSSYEVKLLWQDEESLITSVSGLMGTDETGTFTVTANSSNPMIEGNAVVALYENGVIRWNWHIWVVKDFNPSQNTGYNSYNGITIMDRNLGATRATPETTGVADLRTYGLYYQWGRKDPFPSAISSGNYATTAAKPIYDINNGNQTIITEMVTASKNLVNAMIRPLCFYYNNHTSVYANWYTPVEDYSIRRIDLWGPDIKSHYDPCPEGWRVPQGRIFDYVVLPENIVTGGVLLGLNGQSIGFFPFPGNINYSSNVVSYGSTFSGQSAIGNSNCVSSSFTAASINPNSGAPKTYGRSVRCVLIE